MLKFKCWYYEQAIRDGNEEKLAAMLLDELPEDIRAIYDSPIKNNTLLPLYRNRRAT